jgi:putative phosphoribosyl transferase
MPFQDRQDAGRQLTALLAEYKDEAPLVLGLPRGGVVVAYEVALALEAPLDVWVVRKVEAPGFPELGLGAVSEGGVVFLDEETIRYVRASAQEVEETVRRQEKEVRDRVRLFRGSRPLPQIEGRFVILVDDGIATGGTARAGVQALRAAGARKIVLAVPVAATQSLEQIEKLVDAVVCVEPSPALYAIGAWYADFRQIADDEVVHFLDLARGSRPLTPQSGRGARDTDPQEIAIPLQDATLNGTRSMPKAPKGLVLFAHGSGSSRFSPRNRYVAGVLHEYGLATLLFDLLTSEEESIDQSTGELRFNIDLLAQRLVGATDWIRGTPEGRTLALGYFGSSTGAAAALVAAAERPALVGAVVSRGGRPDLAWDSLPRVRAPTLFIVGGRDDVVIELNRRAYSHMTAPRETAIVPGATHLFEEPGTLEAVARLAGEWFERHFGKDGKT